MSLKKKQTPLPVPSSGHPEAEIGARISRAALPSTLLEQQRKQGVRERKPIVSINGRDVEQIPETPGRAA